MSEEVALYESHDISVARDPELVLSEAQKAAKALTTVIAGKKKPFILNGEQYLEYEDWQTVAKFYGLCAKTHDAMPCEVDDIKGAKAEADVIDVRSGLIVGHAEAYCLRDEKQWTEKPFFQLSSMAQTRAGAKALRNVLAWVVVLAGYKPIPAEEMQDVGQKPHIQPPQSKSQSQSATGKGEEKPSTETVVTGIEDIRMKTGGTKEKPWTKYTIIAGGEYNTFSETIAKDAKRAKESGLQVLIEFKTSKYGNEIVSLVVQEPEGDQREPGSDDA